MVASLHLLALLLYGGAAAVLGASLAAARRHPPVLALVLLLGGLGLHAAGLAVFTTRYDDLPLVGLGPSLSTLAFLTATSLLLAGVLKEARPLGVVLLPFVAALCAAALLLGIVPAGEPLRFDGIWFLFHVVPSLLGYAALALAFAAGLLYLLQFRELKGKRFGRMFRFFPSLETLDRVGRRALVTGFVALTLGLMAGTVWVTRFAGAGGLSTKIAWGILTWLVFAGALLARRRGVSGDRRAATVAVVGFVVVVVAYIVLRVAVPSGRLFL
ncbi:MAG TPA: cytochrome c biogenesis protein CcsA [Longimicrobiales bacterium]|nr:cytochrome c biogenesis protein CcsA [Longimicrobiales bacterium]